MERLEIVGTNTFVLRTRQLGPDCWCCDMYERHPGGVPESFVLEDFGASEIEAIAMALSDAQEPLLLTHH